MLHIDVAENSESFDLQCLQCSDDGLIKRDARERGGETVHGIPPSSFKASGRSAGHWRALASGIGTAQFRCREDDAGKILRESGSS